MGTDTTTTAELWAVNVLGPDDVLCMRSREKAEQWVADMSAAWAKYVAANPDTTGYRPDFNAAVIPWDGTPEQHAAEVERLERDGYEA